MTRPQLHFDEAHELQGVVKRCRDIMRKDKGLNGELDRLPQLTWIMLLKFLDDMEEENEAKAQLRGEEYPPIIPSPYRWRDWAGDPEGITGDALISFFAAEQTTLPDGTTGEGLFEKLRTFEGTGDGKREVVSRVFRGVNNEMQNGYLIREVVNKVDEISFTSSEHRHTLSILYENLLQEMRDAAGDSGEFYTPRPVVRMMVEVIDPQIDEKVLDPACGTCGFLVEAYNKLDEEADTVEARRELEENTLFGKEAKSLPYLLGEMNLLLHGVDSPNIEFGNSLTVQLTDIGDENRYDVVLTNPPFGGEEEKSIQANFPSDTRSSDTQLLFLQLVMRRLRRPEDPTGPGGRAGIIVPDGILFGDEAYARVKEKLIRDFNLHTVVRLPPGVFEPYTEIPTNILFFDRDSPTEEIWFYEHPLPPERQKLKNPCYTKTNPLKFEEFEPLIEWWDDREETDQAWVVHPGEVLEYDDEGNIEACDLDLKNPNSKDDVETDPPEEILERIIETEEAILEDLREVEAEMDKI